MVLPGSPVESAARLRGKGSDPLYGKTAAIVVRVRESRIHGQRRQSKDLREYSDCGGAKRLEGLQGQIRRAAQDRVSEKTALEGKPDALKRARPVWEGAR
jgi:hypothetical protein